MNTPLVVILAGGEGKNFAPFVTNKLMWPFFGKPFVTTTVDKLREAGLTDIIAVTSDATDEYCRLLGLRTVIQKEPKGMDDAVSQVREITKGRSMLVVNGDDMLDVSFFTDILQTIETTNPDLCVAGFETKELLPLGYYDVDGDHVVSIVEKPTADTKPSNYASLVGDYFKNADELFAQLDLVVTDESTQDMRYELAKSVLMKTHKTPLVEYTGYWRKLKYPHHVLDVSKLYLEHMLSPLIEKMNGNNNCYIHPTATVSPLASVDATVYIDEGAKVDEYAIIKGPTYIGRGTRVGSHTLVRQSIVEKNSTVGFGSEVARSYVGPHCDIHHAYIGDSVLEGSVNMSWGSVTANVRLDKKSVRVKLPSGKVVDTERGKLGALIASGSFIGVNASTMPGAVLAPNSKVLPHSTMR